MTTVRQLCQSLEGAAPLALAEPWDNVGLLLGARDAPVERVMTCLTVTPATAAEAVRERAQLVVSHHPLPFRPLKTIVDDAPPGRLVLSLAAAGVAVYSAHTAYDSAVGGVNDQIADGLNLTDVLPLLESDAGVGSGRIGVCVEDSFAELCLAAARFFGIASLRTVGAGQDAVDRVAIACGSGGSLLEGAIAAGASAMVTGEMTFHDCLAAEAAGVGVVLLGHYASERFAMQSLAARLAAAHPELTVWASRDERDPLAAFTAS
ncbi:Putative GTP cyclohydrolase 1 type 2 [Pirellulimonas nuda]|uniref:GTP cyclohydrolase 1 type 2 homolog n=1 Tax=Pirellulimonas nuda TaxID=2528009 RepID=A0A518DJD2_9BACT|nr:Nif3-like dinuclear metal center hexameric protein [Pirellulimonas nuda]QDU91585.1 Putative GTP cyclohydrolase 1 type 2 [Pirellulimonas nuda]